jgi:hypothetical protein
MVAGTVSSRLKLGSSQPVEPNAKNIRGNHIIEPNVLLIDLI